jgi:hypothetical protein
MWVVSKEVVQDQQPFDVAWRTIGGLKIRYAANGRGGETVVLFSPWRASTFSRPVIASGRSERRSSSRLSRNG